MTPQENGLTPTLKSRRPGRKRKATAITLPSLLSLTMAERAKAARTRLQAVARPLAFAVSSDGTGGVTVSQRRSPETRPDDRLTPERRRHAEEAELLVVMDTFTTDAGEKTDLKRQRLIQPLEQMWKAGVLDAGQYAAACRYQREHSLAILSGPGSTVRYEPRMIEGGNDRFLLPIEAAADYLARLARAQLACGPRYVRTLEWIAAEPIGWRFQARMWWPGESERQARWLFKRELRAVCSMLEWHYR